MRTLVQKQKAKPQTTAVTPKTPQRASLTPRSTHEQRTQNPATAGAGGRSLPDSTRAFFEPRFGFDFSQVRVYSGPRASALARAIGARAYTTGREVVFGAGAFAPETAEGRRLIAHELVHIIQQRGEGRSERGFTDPDDATEVQADRIADAVTRGGGIDGPTQRLIYDAARRPSASHQVARALEQPIVEKAPAGAMSIERFIELVELEETRYPPDEQRNTSLMLTRMREIFYDRKGWNKYLIQAAAGIAAPYQTTRRITGREKVDLPGPFNLDVVRDVYEVTNKEGKTPDIAKNQEIELADGSFIDIGHVFAGLDAFNHPQAVGMFNATIESNVDAVTWIGDLGSVLAEWQFKFVNKGAQLTEAEAQPILSEFASAQDMLGNIDAYVIKKQFAVEKIADGQRVSEILRSYYLGAPTTASGEAREHRYSRFCGSIGLTGWNGSAFANEAAWVEKYGEQVSHAAALYVGATTEGVAGYPAALGMSMNKGSDLLAELFLKALKERVLTEPLPAKKR